MYKKQSCYCVLFLTCALVIQAKIVFLNGTEVSGDNLKIINVTTTSQPVQKWFSVFNPRNISNHSGDKTNKDLHTLEEKKDEEELESFVEEDYDHSSNSTLSTRDSAVLSSLRFIWSDITPIITILSTIIGLFLVFVMIESPLSPLPVPPLPYPPIGPYPPTNMYPFGVPPAGHPYGVRYAGPQNHATYRIPRNLQLTNETEAMDNMIEKVIDSILPDKLEDFFKPKGSTWAEQLTDNIKSFLTNLGSAVENKSSELLEEIKESTKGL